MQYQEEALKASWWQKLRWRPTSHAEALVDERNLIKLADCPLESKILHSVLVAMNISTLLLAAKPMNLRQGLFTFQGMAPAAVFSSEPIKASLLVFARLLSIL